MCHILLVPMCHMGTRPPHSGEAIKTPITDIVQFFNHTTDAYNKFAQSIHQLIATIPDLSPQQLSEECQKLLHQRAQLEILDQQMFDILELAGGSIHQDTMIERHSIALAKANMASEQLYQKLHELKLTLLENQSSHAAHGNQGTRETKLK